MSRATTAAIVSVGICFIWTSRLNGTPARFWISASGTSTSGPESPTIQGINGGTDTIYVWAQPGSSASGVSVLQDFSLDLVTSSASPVISFRRDLLKVYNPLSGPTNLQHPRFQYVADTSQGFPTSSSQDDTHHGIKSCLNGICGLRGISGYAIAASNYAGIGVLPCNAAANCTMTTGSNPVPAWLVASIGFDTTQLGTTSFNLQIGYSGMQYVDTALANTAPEEDVSVLFGTGNGPYTYSPAQCNAAACVGAETTTSNAPADLVIVGVQPLTGDYNRDGIVNAADYSVWRGSLGSTINLAADGDGSGLIDVGDYNVWKSNFGNHAGSGSAANSAVPEPATLVLLIMAAAGWCLFRRGAA